MKISQDYRMVDSIEQDIEIMQRSICRETDIGFPILSAKSSKVYVTILFYMHSDRICNNVTLLYINIYSLIYIKKQI